MVVITKDREIHLADILFSKMCQEKYGLNKGIYNTIDSWLYAKGIEDILKRRKALLDFLKFNENKSDSSKGRGRLKFGSGGLSAKLHDFWNLHFDSTYRR